MPKLLPSPDFRAMPNVDAQAQITWARTHFILRGARCNKSHPDPVLYENRCTVLTHHRSCAQFCPDAQLCSIAHHCFPCSNVRCFPIPFQCLTLAHRYQSLAPMYYRGAHAAILIYDVTSAHTFERAKFWTQELHTNVGPGIGEANRAWGSGCTTMKLNRPTGGRPGWLPFTRVDSTLGSLANMQYDRVCCGVKACHECFLQAVVHLVLLHSNWTGAALAAESEQVSVAF